jgi:hypothetical protein
LVDLDEILYGGDDIEEDDLDSILFKPVASIISKWRTFKLLRWAQLLNLLVDLDEILYGGDGIEYYLDYVVLNPVASTIPKWRTFKLLSWVLLLNRLVDFDEILYGEMTLKVTSTLYYLIV